MSWRVGRLAGVKLTLANNCRISAVDRWRHPAERKPPRLLLKDSTKGICTAARARVGGHPPRGRTTVFARSAEPLAECPGSSRCECCGICHNAEACFLVACNRLAQLLNVLLAKAQRAVQTSSRHMGRVGQIESMPKVPPPASNTRSTMLPVPYNCRRSAPQTWRVRSVLPCLKPVSRGYRNGSNAPPLEESRSLQRDRDGGSACGFFPRVG